VTDPGQLNRRVTFRQRAVDDNNERGGAWVSIATRYARVQPKIGGEAVQAARMAGTQPVVIYVRRDATTKTIDNGWSAVDYRDATIIWDIQSVIVTEDLQWVECLAIQRKGGSDG
jgi:head-tail adaptor